MTLDRTSPDGCAAPLLALTGIHKRFGGVHALRGASMVLREPGVVHGLMGQNGSGKSTLLGVLSGQLRPDEGNVAIQGHQVSFRSPVDALSRGIAMVSQETAVAQDLTVAENVLLGRGLLRGPMGIDWQRTRERAREVLEQIGLDYDPAWIVRRLRPDQKQMVEIARALSADARILVLDEPTSSLTDDEVVSLFAAIRSLKDHGVAVVFVSHRLSEVFEICDEMTVLCDGTTVAHGSVCGFDTRSLVACMVGTESPDEVVEVRDDRSQAPSALAVTELSVPGCLHDVSLDVREGEIVGLAGLVGSGRSELLETVFGMRASSSGALMLSGEAVDIREPKAAITHGLGFVPPDRKSQGVVLSMSVRENLGMAATSTRSRLGNPGAARDAGACAEVAAAMGITAPMGAAVSTLSGGNQQKVALGKWLVRLPRVLLLDEPTRGVDVAAKAEIHRHLRRVADRGVAILVSSSEYDELLELCDRVVVLFRGTVVATLPRHHVAEAKIAALAGGHT